MIYRVPLENLPPSMLCYFLIRVAQPTSETMGRTLLKHAMRTKTVGKGYLISILDICSRGLTSFLIASHGGWDLSETFAEFVSTAHPTLCGDVDTCDSVQGDDLNRICVDMRCKRKEERGRLSSLCSGRLT
jgi:hypothetical protein